MLARFRSIEIALQKSLATRQPLLAALCLALLGILFEGLRRLGDLKLHVVETIAIALAAGLIYLVALYFFEASADAPSSFWLILAGALLFRMLLFPLVPTLSTDIHRYRWEGRVQQAGYNPYSIRPDDPRLASLRDENSSLISGRDIPTIYPPLSELLWRWQFRLLPGLVAFKLPSLLADLLVVGMLAGWVRHSGGRNFTLAIYAWNPLVIIEFAASGHHDSLALAAVFAAGLLIIRGRGTLSTLALAAGALIKLFPIVLFPLWLRRADGPRSLWSWLNALAALALAAVCAWPYRSGWQTLLHSVRQYEAGWRYNNASLYAVLVWFSGSTHVAEGIGVGVVAGLAIWVAARRIDSMRAAFLLFGAILILSPNSNAWYFTWVVPWLAFFPNPAWLLLTVLQVLSYHVLINFQASGLYQFQPFYLWLAYGPFYAWLLCRAFRPAPPPTGEPTWQRAAFR